MDELVRPNQSSSRMLPAESGLKADNPARIKGYNGLVKIPEFFAFQSVSQIRFDLQTRHHAGTHIRVKHLRAALAQRLGPIHSRIGVPQHVIWVFVSGVAQSDSNAYRGENLSPTQYKGRCKYIH